MRNSPSSEWVVIGMSNLSFSVNWDYRCPFARIVNEHVVVALSGGAPWNVEFLPFSLTQVHVEEEEIPAWENPKKATELLAVQVGIVGYQKYPQLFPRLHLALFDARHEEGKDLRDKVILDETISKVGIDPNEIFKEIESGWPLKEFRAKHEESVEKYSTFGVPTIFIDGKAAFVRLMTRANGDAKYSIHQIEKIVDQINNHSEINELKHTTISN